MKKGWYLRPPAGREGRPGVVCNPRSSAAVGLSESQVGSVGDTVVNLAPEGDRTSAAKAPLCGVPSVASLAVGSSTKEAAKANAGCFIKVTS